MRTYALERDPERLQSRLTSVEEDCADATKSLEAVRADLCTAEGRVEELGTDIARLTRERDEARERAASLSRELLGAMQARDSYRMSAERRVGMRREVEEILGCGDTMGDNAFGRGIARLRELVEAESRAARLEEALRASVVAMKRWSAEEDGLPVAPIGAHEAVAAAEAIVGYVWAGWGPDPTRAALGEEGTREEREKEKGK